MVFSGKKWKSVLGVPDINWNHDRAIIGVFYAINAEEACKAAGLKNDNIGTFFAVPGFACGIDMMDTDDRTQEYGTPEEKISRMEQLLDRRLTELTEAITRPQLDRGDDNDG